MDFFKTVPRVTVQRAVKQKIKLILNNKRKKQLSTITQLWLLFKLSVIWGAAVLNFFDFTFN